MFDFLTSIFSKIISLVASAIIAVGLISTPSDIVQQPIDLAPTEEQINATISNEDITSEVEALKSLLLEEKQKRQAFENKIIQNSVPVKTKNSSATKTYITPSGAIIDENGNILNQNELTQKQILSELQRQNNLLEEKKNDGFSGTEVVARVKPSVALIVTEGHGSGFVIESDGLILTNAHVVRGQSSVSVKLYDGRTYTGSVIGKNEIVELALIRINASGLPALTLGNSSLSLLPDTSIVYAFGYPLVQSTMTVEDGIITARRFFESGIEHLQTNAGIQPGNSGGPLVNNKAEVIGINKSGITTEDRLGVGFNFAIPINVAKDYISRLKAGEQIFKNQSPQSVAEESSRPPAGSTIDIPRSVVVAIYYNPTLICEQLAGVPLQYKDECRLHKNYYNDYNWNIIEDL